MAVELPWKKLPDTFNLEIVIVNPFENLQPCLIKYGMCKTHKQGINIFAHHHQ